MRGGPASGILHTAMRIVPARRFKGRFSLPGDKSICHRLAILGALAKGRTVIENFSTAVDCASTLSCLSQLGVEIRRSNGTVEIHGGGAEALRASAEPLDAGNSGSTLRMLAGPLAGRPFRSVLTGDESLRRRPVERIAAPLRAMGARVETSDGRPPLTVEGASLRAISWDLPVASAQAKTAVLLAALQAEGTTTVSEPLPSRDHTERLLPFFGARVEREGLSISARGPAPLRAYSMRAPGDASSAAFLVVAALVLPDSELVIQDVLLNPLRIAFVDVLKGMGARIGVGLTAREPEPTGWIAASSSELHGLEVPPDLVPALIDEVPALAVAAAFARGTTRISGASELRVKESDRVAALAGGLARMGSRVDERPDGLIVHGGTALHGACVEAHGDHRIAMALAVAALAAEGETEIADAECASVSFPEFYGLIAQASSG
ncbi:MAG TPA: 3-phosphoshikimate 1-carboxyvinyltransferase [Vicinamibacteria bacterium]|nr:3-phosphoshikimate 1-carboxyvinyltransferase [Vicinamibacteria bacterium]